MRIVLALVPLLLLPLAGCLDGNSGDADLDTIAKPWKSTWTAEKIVSDINYNPDEQMVEVVTDLTIRNLLGEDRNYVVMELEPYTISRITDGLGNDLAYTVKQICQTIRGNEIPSDDGCVTSGQLPVLGFAGNYNLINITLPDNFAPGSTQDIHMEYSGWAVQDATTVPAGAPNDFAANFHIYMIPYLDGEIATWIEFNITYPADWTTLASAELLGTETVAGEVTDHYGVYSSYISFYSTQGLESLTDVVEGVTLTTYFFPDMRVQGQTTHDITKRMIRFGNTYTGPFPYEHLRTVPHQVAANAFSTPTMTHMGINFYRETAPQVPVQFGRFTPYAAGQDGFEMVVVHEDIHNWWGHAIEGNNTNVELGPRDNWITEGITTFLSELVWFEHEYGEDDAAASAEAKVKDQDPQNRALDFGGDPNAAEPGIAEAGSDYYEKTALALRSLQAYGIATDRPDAVFAALRSVMADHSSALGGKGAMGTYEMFDYFEAAFGEDLDWFWNAWWFSGDLADFSINNVASTIDAASVTVANDGAVKSAALVRIYTATGVELQAWGVVDAGATEEIVVVIPATAAGSPIVRAVVDPLQHIYESDETNNVWTLAPAP